jgi:CheY-like chemotaxis protein
LLVEDNQDMRAFLRMHLDLHYDVREAENGLTALAAVEAAMPDVILSDVMMPHLNGLELCQQLKGDERWRQIPVILLSAKAAVDQRVEGLRAGADDYLGKPFSVPELLARLEARLPRAAPRPEIGDQAWLEHLEACMAENLGCAGFDVTALAGKLGYSGRQLRRRIVAAYRLVPAALLLQRRLERAHALIEARRHATVAEVAYAVGLSPTYFSRRYRQAYRCPEIKL